MQRIRARLTYANVMSSIAAFGVLAGGGAYAQQRIGTSELANRAVTTPKIAPQAVGTGKLKRHAVGTAKIKRRAVGTGKLKRNAVGTGRIRPGAVNTSRIAHGAVDATRILDGAVHRSKIAIDAVGANELADRAVTTTKITPGAVGAARLADGAVIRDKLHDNMKPYWAVVDENGAALRSRGVVGSLRVEEGVYDVTFEHDVSNCAWLAVRGTAGADALEGNRLSPAAHQPAGFPTVVRVQTWDAAGDEADDHFHLSVVC